MMIPVILSGGSGERLWPLSRQKYPKPFLELFERSLFSDTLNRVKQWGDPLVVAAESQKVLLDKSLGELGLHGKAHSLLEPRGRNTAPAVALACRYLESVGKSDAVITLLPADHYIEDTEGFNQNLALADETALQGQVVTLGIRAHHPATGYGYIEVAKGEWNTACAVERFVEKPNEAKAREFLDKGNYYWNAGIFTAQVSKLISLFKEHQSELWSLMTELKEFSGKELSQAYDKIQSVSFDVGIMEKVAASEVACIPVDIGWSDLGSWDAVADAKTQGSGHHPAKVQLESTNIFVEPHRDRTYAFLGVKDLIVVDTADALLVAHKDKLGPMKELVTRVGERKPQLLEEHVYEDRPWGRYEILRDEGHFKSKVIVVDAGQQISYQSHDQREEHWVVTKGIGEVVLNEKVLPVKRGSSIHIPLKAKHRIRNTSTEPLEFVEVQIGSYFGEDDITRYEDDYSRS